MIEKTLKISEGLFNIEVMLFKDYVVQVGKYQPYQVLKYVGNSLFVPKFKEFSHWKGWIVGMTLEYFQQVKKL